MTAARSRRAGRGRKVTQEIKRGTTRTATAKAREFAKKRAEDYAYFSPHMGPIKPKPKAAQTGTSRKAMRDAPKPEREIKRGTTRVRKTADGSKKTKPTLNKQGAAAFAKALDEAGKRKAAKKAEAEAKAKAEAKAEAEKKKDKEKKTLFGIEIKPSSRFAGRGGKARRVAGRAMGGMMKSKMASKGGAKGGRMPTGMKRGGPASKFPDLSGDGKVTQKDILMGKGVIGGRGLPKKPAKPKAGGRSSDAIKKARTAKMDEMKDRLKASKMGPGKTKMEMANAKKKAGGGMMKSKGMAKGGAMKKKGYAMGGSVKKKGMAKGGAMKKKGYAMGGMTKKGMAKGGAMTKKGMAKGGTNKKRAVSRKPRGVGAALRGYGKAMKK